MCVYKLRRPCAPKWEVTLVLFFETSAPCIFLFTKETRLYSLKNSPKVTVTTRNSTLTPIENQNNREIKLKVHCKMTVWVRFSRFRISFHARALILGLAGDTPRVEHCPGWLLPPLSIAPLTPN